MSGPDLSRRAFLTGAAALALRGQTPQARPNVLWICTDQQRFDTISALGNEHIRTPNIDRLVASGVSFTNAYCQATVCTPSRASFMTGVYPSTLHVNRNGNAEFPERNGPRLVSRILSDAGYDCGLVGKLHLAGSYGRVEPRIKDGYSVFEWSQNALDRDEDSQQENGYFRWLRSEGVDWRGLIANAEKASSWSQPYKPGIETRYQHATWCANEAIRFINDGSHRPWLLNLNICEPHPPNHPSAEYLNRIDLDNLPRPLFRDEEMISQQRFEKVDHQTKGAKPPDSYPWRQMKAAYYADIELVDDQIGRILSALDSTGQRDNTLIVFSADHGEMLGDHGLLAKGCRFYEGAVHVPLILSWPGKFKAGLKSSALVELTDIVPTLLDAIGVKPPTDFLPEAAKGKSLVPILTGKVAADRHHDFVRCEYYDALDLPNHSHANMLFDGQWKLVIYHGLDVGELYDLKADPNEFQNRWNDRGASEVRCKLTKKLFDATMLATDPGQPRIGRF